MIRLDHMAVAARDKQEWVTFLREILDLGDPTCWGPLVSLTLDDGGRLDCLAQAIPRSEQPNLETSR